MKLQDKVVLITGSTSGIGIACAKQALKDGAFKVILSDLDDIKMKEFDISLTGTCDFIKLDVRSESDWENIIK